MLASTRSRIADWLAGGAVVLAAAAALLWALDLFAHASWLRGWEAAFCVPPLGIALGVAAWLVAGRFRPLIGSAFLGNVAVALLTPTYWIVGTLVFGP